jgi:hypothetical protein
MDGIGEVHARREPVERLPREIGAVERHLIEGDQLAQGLGDLGAWP